MKRLFLPAILLLSLFLVSCSKYQINILSSTNSVKDEKTGIFTTENDSVKITYSFNGEKAPVSIHIYNKLNKPIFVDWNRSAAVVDGKAISYTNKDVVINAGLSAVTDTYKFSNNRNALLAGDVSYSSGSISGLATLPQNTTFLPPHSETENVLLNIRQKPILYAHTSLKADETGFTDGYTLKKVKVQSANFSKNNSPLVFRSFLTLYTIDNNVVKPMAFEHEFYVSKLISTTHNPLLFEEYSSPRGDFFISSNEGNSNEF
jgi:hypothetical protein